MIGAHGKVALLALPMLVAAGHEVVGVVRNPAHLGDVEAAGAAAAIGDIERLGADELTSLLEGNDVVVWSAGAGGGDPARTYAVDRDAAVRAIDAAVQTGIPRFVMVSYFGAGPDHCVPADNPFFAYAEAKTAADEHLAGSPLDWTILRPSTLTNDDPTGRVETGAGVTAGRVSRGNVAGMLTEVVNHPERARRRVIAFNDGDQPLGVVVQTTGEHHRP